jgi:GT2 family glycosyltransferase
MVRALGLHALARRLPAIGRLAAGGRIATEYESAVTAVEPISTSMVSGAVVAIGTDAFRELGGFDERFFLYFEDADLCRRAANAGMPIRYVPAAVARHVGGASSAVDYHFGPHHARSMRLYLHKWHGGAGDVVALLLLWLRWLGSAIVGRPGAHRAWRALVAAASHEDPRR